MNAMLNIIENGYKWGTLPKKYNKWYAIYIKLLKNRAITEILKAIRKKVAQ